VAEKDLMNAARLIVTGLIAVMGLVAPAGAQTPQAPRPWLVPELLAAAKAEGNAMVMYASMNEEEALPFWKVFEEATGIKVSFLRLSDAAIRSRISIEHRARQRAWDLVATTPVYRLGPEILSQFDPPEAKYLIPQARDPDKRWYGVYGNYHTPAYNTIHVKAAELPKTYEEFLDRKQWAGKVVIDATDAEWLAGLLAHYGEERGRKLARDIVGALRPAVLDGHLVVARQVAAGEYWIALNNFLPLTINVKLAGSPTDYWVLDPVVLAFGSIGINTLAPHPKTALLAANFMLSEEGQTLFTRKGRLPARPGVETNPPGIMNVLAQKKIIHTVSTPEEQRKMQQTFSEIFRPR
jgi:iron(III) transport system substrate-binding protein